MSFRAVCLQTIFFVSDGADNCNVSKNPLSISSSIFPFLWCSSRCFSGVDKASCLFVLSSLLLKGTFNFQEGRGGYDHWRITYIESQAVAIRLATTIRVRLQMALESSRSKSGCRQYRSQCRCLCDHNELERGSAWHPKSTVACAQRCSCVCFFSLATIHRDVRCTFITIIWK